MSGRKAADAIRANSERSVGEAERVPMHPVSASAPDSLRKLRSIRTFPTGSPIPSRSGRGWAGLPGKMPQQPVGRLTGFFLVYVMAGIDRTAIDMVAGIAAPD